MGEVRELLPMTGKGRTEVGMTWWDTRMGPRTKSRLVGVLRSDLRLLSLVKERSSEDQSVFIRLMEGLPRDLENGPRDRSTLRGEDRMEESWGRLSIDAEVLDRAGEGGRENLTLRSVASSSSGSVVRGYGVGGRGCR